MLENDDQIREMLQRAYSYEEDTTEDRSGCPNLIRLMEGALTEVERRHIDNGCRYCKTVLAGTAGNVHNRHIRFTRPKLALTLAAALVIVVSLFLSRRHSHTNQSVSPTDHIQLVSDDSGEIENAFASIAKQFGGNRNAEVAVQALTESKHVIQGLLSPANQAKWFKDEEALAKWVGNPCYYSELASARSHLAQQIGSERQILDESATHLGILSEIGIKQMLLNMNWDVSRIGACADDANRRVIARKSRARLRRMAL